ncbi:hypothetical protein [Agathobacter rectalis]|mgnify:FL=1|jgi:hypothetical protein|uniref:hypothetical protein n=1 Tax=Agathobacter rectalis TaxID=39491 RepID=UPI0027D34BA3|nr:hypothetical protein [Agathobacter rectalis]MCB7108890.1 hypothetical protein [Agathobacter rectalis]MCG4812182.1 hypothetical protein [Agathobacter rectalis]
MSYTIKSADELKNPFLCYCVFREFNKEINEDYIDIHYDIIDTIPFLFWLKGKNVITNEQLEKYLSINDSLYLKDILKDDKLFTNTCGMSYLSDIKTYTLLAEYMCQTKEFREKLWNSIHNIENDIVSGISPICIIDDTEMFYHNYHLYYVFQMSIYEAQQLLSYKDQFNIGINMTISEADTCIPIIEF